MSFRDAMLRQGSVCTELGSPFTGALLRLLADRLHPGTPLTDRLFQWPGDISARGASVPLRLAGALHGLVLDGSDLDLKRVYPPNLLPDDDVLWSVVAAALNRHEERINEWLDRPPQTNEVGRSAALISAGHWLTHRLGLPLKLSELGASAGLNLMWDRFALKADGNILGPDNPTFVLRPDWRGDPVPTAAPNIIDRRGTDLTPLNPQENQVRMLAYIWPDQKERLDRTKAAIAIADAVVDQADAADWLATRLAAPTPGTCHMIYHTIAWQYFSPAVSDRASSIIETAGTRATPDAPLAWFAMEADDQTPGAAMTLRLWPGDQKFDLGRIDFHGRWVDWRPKQVT